MDYETEQRFQRIETDVEIVAKGLARIVELQQIFVQGVTQSQQSLQDLFAKAQTMIADYVSAADVRMKRMETNLDALIRVITYGKV